MKTLLLVAISAFLCQGFAIAENPASQTSAASTIGTSARDGFTRSGTQVLFTREGLTQSIEKEVMLENGLRVQSDGTVTFPNGDKTALRNNQLLTLQGTFEEVALTPDGIAPVTSAGPPVSQSSSEIGLASTDGIYLSGNETVVTRNGVSERLKQELRLSDGTRVEPNGNIIRPDGARLNLGASQVLGFDGALRALPMRR